MSINYYLEISTSSEPEPILDLICNQLNIDNEDINLPYTIRDIQSPLL